MQNTHYYVMGFFFPSPQTLAGASPNDIKFIPGLSKNNEGSPCTVK